MSERRFSRADILSGKAVAESKTAKPEQSQGFYDKDVELDSQEKKPERQTKKTEKARKKQAHNKLNSLVRQINRLDDQRKALDKKIQSLYSNLVAVCDHKQSSIDWVEDSDGVEHPKARCSICLTIIVP